MIAKQRALDKVHKNALKAKYSHISEHLKLCISVELQIVS